MRPSSIILFERLFLASQAIAAGVTAVGWEDVVRLADKPELKQLGLGSEFAVGVVVASFALYLLLWYLVARKASNVAKWILVVLVALGALSVPIAFAAPLTMASTLGLAVYALEVAAVAHLFRADARAWLGGARPAADTAASD